VRWPGQTSGAFGLALNFLLVLFFFSRKRKVHPSDQNKVMYFLLPVQKKVPKKNTPQMMNRHWREP
jgi:hypothetical protein